MGTICRCCVQVLVILSVNFTADSLKRVIGTSGQCGGVSLTWKQGSGALRARSHMQIQGVTITWRDRIRMRLQHSRAPHKTKARICSCDSFISTYLWLSYLFKVQHRANRWGEFAMFAKNIGLKAMIFTDQRKERKENSGITVTIYH